jgi:glycosyltransferase involved in cell wall biosynthesis
VKIILVHNAYQQPGGEDVVFEQERQLLERAGHQVVMYRRSNHEMEGYSAVQRLALVPKAVWSLETRREFAKLLAEEKPQVVHVHNTLTMISPSVYWACLEANIPVVQTVHNFRLFCPAATFYRGTQVCEECVEHSLWRGVRYGCYRDSRPATATVALMLAVNRRIGTYSRAINCYIAFHEFARKKCVEGGLPAEKIAIKPNFVHPDPGARAGDGDYALFVGRLSPEKGIGTLLAAWTLLRNDVPLVIAGDGPMRSQMEEGITGAGLPNVSYRGRLSRDETLATMKGARFLIFPSEWYEGFPVTIAEAFACGIPVICSRLGAMQELIADGRTGLHFASRDAGDLAQKVEWAWSHPQEMQAMGREAREEYLSKYTAEKNYPMLMQIYQRAMAAAA